MAASMNTTDTIPPPPEGLNYIAAIHPSLNLLLIGTIWSSLLIPISVALVLFSTPLLRRTPIFLLNVASISLGLAEGILSGYLEISAIISPLTPIGPAALTTFTCLSLLVPLFVESILILRLVAVYPPRRTQWKYCVIIFGPPIIIKILRLVNGGIFISQWQKTLNSIGNPIQAGQSLWGHQPWTKIEWFSQLVDNSYTSLLFLFRLYQGRSLASKSRVDSRNRTSYSTKLKALFWIAVSNFVFPVLLSLAQLIFVFRDSSYLDGGYIFLTNNYVEIIGVLCATVWAIGMDWTKNGGSSPSNGTTALSIPQFAQMTSPGGQRITQETFSAEASTVLRWSVGEPIHPGNQSDFALESLGAKSGKVDENVEASIPPASMA